MEKDALTDHIAASQALIAHSQALLAQQAEVFKELQEHMAEQLGCSVWDLELTLEKDLSAEDKQSLAQEAGKLIKGFVPHLDELPAAQPTPAAASASALRPKRRMV